MDALPPGEPCLGWSHPTSTSLPINVAIHPKMNLIIKDDDELWTSGSVGFCKGADLSPDAKFVKLTASCSRVHFYEHRQSCRPIWYSFDVPVLANNLLLQMQRILRTTYAFIFGRIS